MAGERDQGESYVIRWQWPGKRRAVVLHGARVVAYIVRRPDGHMTTIFAADLPAHERRQGYARLQAALQAEDDRRARGLDGELLAVLATLAVVGLVWLLLLAGEGPAWR